MTKRTKSDILKDRMIKALEKSLGVVTSACKNAEVPRSTFYDWIKDDNEFKKRVDNIQDIALDFVESQLFKQIKEQIPVSTIFYLKTKGKKRGYIERTEFQLDIKEKQKNTLDLFPKELLNESTDK